MTAPASAPIDEPNTDKFIVDDWETTELPVPVTDQATATAEPPATATPPENSPNNRKPASEAYLYIDEYPEYEYDGSEQYYVTPRCYAPQLQRFTPRDPAERC